jgi:hypothetical protein
MVIIGEMAVDTKAIAVVKDVLNTAVLEKNQK